MKHGYPENRKPLGTGTFRFACHAGLSCFTKCCHDVSIDLRPYDIVRLKVGLGGTTGEILRECTATVRGNNPDFPAVRLRMRDNPGRPCPFLADGGCGVYENRPDACRTYPLERGIAMEPFKPETLRESYFVARQPICLGHGEGREWTVEEWVRDQGIRDYNRMNDLWAEIELLFRAFPNVWGLEGWKGQRFRMAFMALYDMDLFREFVFGSSFLKRYRIRNALLRKLRSDDEHLLRFGHLWVKMFLFNASTPAIGPRRN